MCVYLKKTRFHHYTTCLIRNKNKNKTLIYLYYNLHRQNSYFFWNFKTKPYDRYLVILINLMLSKI